MKKTLLAAWILIFSTSFLNAAAQLQNYTGATSGCPGETVTISFEITAAAWEQAYYAVGFSTDAVPSASDSWMGAANCGAGSCPNRQADPNGQENATPTWNTISMNVTVPAGFSTGYVVIFAKAWGGSCGDCSYEALLTPAFVCNPNTPTPSATPTPTRTPTPLMSFSKSVNVTQAHVGDTVTYCINWTNDSSGTRTRTFIDNLDSHLTYVGGQAGCSGSGQTVTCSFSTASNTSGVKCFWVVVNSSP